MYICNLTGLQNPKQINPLELEYEYYTLADIAKFLNWQQYFAPPLNIQLP